MLSILQGNLIHYAKILFLIIDDRRKVHYLVFVDDEWIKMGFRCMANAISGYYVKCFKLYTYLSSFDDSSTILVRNSRSSTSNFGCGSKTLILREIIEIG